MTEGIEITLIRLECVRLAALAEELQHLLGSRDQRDEAIGRLTPNPYPDDSDAAAQFSESTAEDLLDRRSADAATVAAALAPLIVGTGQQLTEPEALTEHRVFIASSDIEAWLRALNAIRLVLASRLGIAHDDAHDPDDPRYGVYDWLGYRLELLIEAADRVN